MTDAATLTDDGLYYAISNEAYQADPVAGGSITSTATRGILPPGCPAKWHHHHTAGSAPKAHFDLGTAAHKAVLGVGDDITIIDAADWRTKAAKTARDDARAAGKVPILQAAWDQIQAMADAVKAHPLAHRLLAPGSGQPEVTAVWTCTTTGARCRARFDWLPNQHPGRLLVPDYKTADRADPDAVARSVTNFGYHVQAAHYLDGLRTLGYADPAVFLFIVQEKDPPYIVEVYELEGEALGIGLERCVQARQLWLECRRDDRWPSYLDGAVAPVTLTQWARRQEGLT